MKNLFWRVGRLWCAGIVLLLLRLTQNRSGFDPATGLLRKEGGESFSSVFGRTMADCARQDEIGRAHV